MGHQVIPRPAFGALGRFPGTPLASESTGDAFLAQKVTVVLLLSTINQGINVSWHFGLQIVSQGALQLAGVVFGPVLTDGLNGCPAVTLGFSRLFPLPPVRDLYFLEWLDQISVFNVLQRIGQSCVPLWLIYVEWFPALGTVRILAVAFPAIV